jgi:hypothetical protein
METSEYIKKKYNIFSEGIVWFKCSGCFGQYGKQYVNRIQVIEKCPHCGEPSFMESHN